LSSEIEAAPDHSPPAAHGGVRAGQAAANAGPGVIAAICIAIAAHLVDLGVRGVPDVVTALVLGILVANTVGKSWPQSGARFVLRYGLRAAIVAIGAGLDLSIVWALGAGTLLLIVGLVATAISLGLMAGRIARLDRNISVLIGVGTAICGASAILAVSPLLRAKPRETAYAITTIFAFNLAALVALPFIGHQLGITQPRFGTWVGTAVNDTSVVVATGYVYGPIAGGIATTVKLTRTILLVPMCVAVGLVFGGTEAKGALAARAWHALPWFVLGFFALAAANTVHLIPSHIASAVAQGGELALVVVLAAVGLAVDIRGILRMGPKPLLVGFALATSMLVLSFGLIALLQIG
jgi:uncharacterized integral membrane protein (TIGR00698 family)